MHSIYYPSTSTDVNDAKADLKIILATRVSFNDPNILDVLIKPDEVSDDLVKNIKDYISKDQDILDFLSAVRYQTVEFIESDMYEPLVRRD